jgi:hypothetical protein
MNEEATRSSVGAIKKNYENTIELLNEEILKRDKMFVSFKNEKEEEIKILHYEIEKKTKEFSDLSTKHTALEENMSNIKGFKPGTTEFDKMQGRINKLDNEVFLYKKVVQKNERDFKKEREEWAKEREQLHTNEVNLLAELRTVKEEKEHQEV